jgi:hypothetical protein
MGFTAFAVFTFAVTQHQAHLARKAARKAKEVEENIFKAKQDREKRVQIRAARIKQAQLQADTIAKGSSGSSASAQGIGSIRTQLASNVGYINSQTAGAEALFQAQGQANAYQGRAELFGQLSSLSSSAARQYGGGSPSTQSPAPSQDDGFRFFDYGSP